MKEQKKLENQDVHVEPTDRNRQRMCGTFVLRQALAEMTEEARETLLEDLENAGAGVWRTI